MMFQYIANAVRIIYISSFSLHPFALPRFCFLSFLLFAIWCFLFAVARSLVVDSFLFGLISIYFLHFAYNTYIWFTVFGLVILFVSIIFDLVLCLSSCASECVSEYSYYVRIFEALDIVRAKYNQTSIKRPHRLHTLWSAKRHLSNWPFLMFSIWVLKPYYTVVFSLHFWKSIWILLSFGSIFLAFNMPWNVFLSILIWCCLCVHIGITVKSHTFVSVSSCSHLSLCSSLFRRETWEGFFALFWYSKYHSTFAKSRHCVFCQMQCDAHKYNGWFYACRCSHDYVWA